MRISDWSSDVCSSDLLAADRAAAHARGRDRRVGQGRGFSVGLVEWRRVRAFPDPAPLQRRCRHCRGYADGHDLSGAGVDHLRRCLGLPRRDARPLGALSGRPPPRAFKRLRRSTVKRDAGMIENDDEAFADNYAERDQAKALREQARAGGLRFEAYLPGDMADWLLAQVERGHFVDPSEPVFATVPHFIHMDPTPPSRLAPLPRLPP